MSSWSQRRKLTYTAIILLLLIGAVGIPAFLYFYTPPSCSDGRRNGNELGVDCGGSCERLCQSAFLPPLVGWTRFEEVAPGLFNVGAYIINNNPDGEARNIPYHVAFYDKDGHLIKDFTGKVTLPSHRNTLAFQGALNLAKRVPAKALFEFTGAPDWNKKADPLSAITIESRDYTEEGSSSALSVGLRNNSVRAIDKLTVYVVLYDRGGNAIGFSKTLIDEIPPGQTVLAPFTWPKSRNGEVVSIEVLPVAE
jgi:hypothetical protein